LMIRKALIKFENICKCPVGTHPRGVFCIRMRALCVPLV
jgi:hypothetical protein